MKLRKFFLLTTSMLILSNPAVELFNIKSLPWTARAEEQQLNDLVVLGQSLTNEQQKETLILLGQHQGNKSKYVYVDQSLVDAIAQEDAIQQEEYYLSAVINPDFAQQGVVVDVLTPENITQVDDMSYRNALITAGVHDTSVQIASVESTDGVNGIVGVFEALNQNGFSLDPTDMQVAYLELKAVAELNSSSGDSLEEVNDWMTDLKVQLIDQQLNGASDEGSVTQTFIQDHEIQDDLAVQYLYEFAEAFNNAPVSQSKDTKEALLSALATPELSTISIEGQTTFDHLEDFVQFYEKAMIDNKTADESGISSDQYNQQTWRLDRVFTDRFEVSYLNPTSNKREKLDVEVLDNNRVRINQKVYDLTSMKVVDEVKQDSSSVLPTQERPSTQPLESEMIHEETDQQPQVEHADEDMEYTDEETGYIDEEVDLDTQEDFEPVADGEWENLPMEEVTLGGNFDWETLWDVADYYQRVISYNYGFTPDVSDWKLNSIDGASIHTYSAMNPDEAISFETFDQSVTITWSDGQWINVDNDTLEILDQSGNVELFDELTEVIHEDEIEDHENEGEVYDEPTLDATEVIWDLQYMYDTNGLSEHDFVLNNDLDDWQVLEESGNAVLLGSLDESGNINQFVQVTLNGTEYTIEIYEADPATNAPSTVWKYNPSNGYFEA